MSRSLLMFAGAWLACAQPAGAAPERDSAAAEYTVTWSAPEFLVRGASFTARLEVEVEPGGSLPAWLLTPEAFEVDGRPLGEREGAALEFQGAASFDVSLDLGPVLARGPERFELTCAGSSDVQAVSTLEPAPAGLEFMKLEAERLTDFKVLLETNRGQILLELWPDVAPNHVRNFLDLCYTGFYEGLIFHRCWPGFMIQGGDATPFEDHRRAPRSVDREFNEQKHVRGVLSMARGPNPDSATSQFFLMHADSSTLDGQYSAFGKMLSGFEALDRIANAPGDPIPGSGGNRPHEDQIILKATVLRATQGD